MDVRRTTLAALSPSARAGAFNAVYAEYVIPIRFDALSVARHIASNDIDVERSPVWLDATGAPIALAALGLRETRAWIGGFGIAVAQRGTGLARELLAETIGAASDAGARRVLLEVLAQNGRAIRTYARGGFVASYEVAGWERAAGAPLPPPQRAAEHDVGPAHAGLLLTHVGETPGTTWQNEFATLRRLDALEAGVAGDPLAPTAHIVYRETVSHITVFAGDGADDAPLANTLAALLVEWPRDKAVAALNVPADARLARVLPAFGFTERWRQHVMQLELISR